MISAGVVAAVSRVPDGLAIAEDGDAVGDAEDLVHFVGDVDDGDARASRSRMRPKSRSTSWSNRELVGSSMSMMRAFMLRARAMASNWRWPMGRVPAMARMPAGEPDLLEKGAAELLDGAAGRGDCR